MNKTIKILGICGSLRVGSYNKLVIKAVSKMLPADTILDTFDIGLLPLFNDDLVSSPPEEVKQLKEKVRIAQAILFISPEYNYSIPGVLKNAIDWASRPHSDNSWDGKPAAIMGATNGIMGTVRMQLQLRQVLTAVNMHALNRPEVLIRQAQELFDLQGNLTDEKTKEKITKLLEKLVDWSKKLNSIGS